MGYGLFHIPIRYLPLGHLILELVDGDARHLGQLLYGVKSCVDELQQVLTHQIARTRHLAHHQRECRHLVLVAARYVAKLAQQRQHLARLNAEV